MCMKIQKWSTNEPKVLKTIPEEERSPYKVVNGKESDITFQDDVITKTIKTLGVTWSPKKDIFHFHNYENLLEEKEPKSTKRSISSLIPTLYDPMGILMPFIVKGKLILQKAWVYRDDNNKVLDWDDPLPSEINN